MKFTHEVRKNAVRRCYMLHSRLEVNGTPLCPFEASYTTKTRVLKDNEIDHKRAKRLNEERLTDLYRTEFNEAMDAKIEEELSQSNRMLLG